jgi:hypothetical protein
VANTRDSDRVCKNTERWQTNKAKDGYVREDLTSPLYVSTQNKNRGKKMRFLGMDTCPSLNDIMEIRCNKCTRSEQGYDLYTCRVACVTSVSRGSLYETFGNKCVKILKFWRTELSYAQNKNRGRKKRLLRMDTCPSLTDIIEIMCNTSTIWSVKFQIIFWNFSDSIVEVNAVVRHFHQPWVLIRQIWQ